MSAGRTFGKRPVTAPSVWTVAEAFNKVDSPDDGGGSVVLPSPRKYSAGVMLSIAARGTREVSVTVFLDTDQTLALSSALMDALEHSEQEARAGKGVDRAA